MEKLDELLSDKSKSNIGFGGASLGNLYQAISDTEAEVTIQAAYEAGIRYFDTAPHYGQGLSERRLGDTLRNCKPNSYTISTKVGRLLKPDSTPGIFKIRSGDTKPVRHGFVSPMPFDIHYDYSYDGIMRSYESSLQRLGLSRINTLFVHDIGELTHGAENIRHYRDLAQGGYRALDELRTNGDVETIGLGVNEWQICEAAMEIGQWDCFLLAGRYTLLEQTALNTFFPKCLSHGAKVILGGIYNSGILATGVKSKGMLHYNYEEAPDEIVERVRKIESICDTHDVTLAAAALHFALAHPVVTSVIPGIGSPHRVKQTMDLYKENIPKAFWNELRSSALVDKRAPLPERALL